MRIFPAVILAALLCESAHAAIVVTRAERVSGAIVINDDKIVSLRTDEGSQKTFAKKDVLQVFNDEGELVYEAPFERPTYKDEVKTRTPGTVQDKRAIIIHYQIGGAAGGFYTTEDRFISAMNIVATYSDGAQQSAQAKLLTMGYGADYQWYSNARWSSMVSYFYRTATQSVTVGDGQNYQKMALAEERLSATHTLLFGREAHFYPSTDEVSFDLIGQGGYELGSYYALATFRSFYTGITPIPAAYLGSTNILFHGPTARVGGGITFRGPGWLFRIAGFYQLAAVFNADRVEFAPSAAAALSVDKFNLLQDYYGIVAVGISF